MPRAWLSPRSAVVILDDACGRGPRFALADSQWADGSGPKPPLAQLVAGLAAALGGKDRPGEDLSSGLPRVPDGRPNLTTSTTLYLLASGIDTRELVKVPVPHQPYTASCGYNALGFVLGVLADPAFVFKAAGSAALGDKQCIGDLAKIVTRHQLLQLNGQGRCCHLTVGDWAMVVWT